MKGDYEDDVYDERSEYDDLRAEIERLKRERNEWRRKWNDLTARVRVLVEAAEKVSSLLQTRKFDMFLEECRQEVQAIRECHAALAPFREEKR